MIFFLLFFPSCTLLGRTYCIHCIIIIEKTLYILLNSSLSILYLTLVTGDFCCHKYQNNMCIRQKFWIWLKGKDMPINSKSSDGGSISKALYRLGISHYEKLSDEVECDKFISFRTLSNLPNLVLQDLNCMVSISRLQFWKPSNHYLILLCWIFILYFEYYSVNPELL